MTKPIGTTPTFSIREVIIWHILVGVVILLLAAAWLVVLL